MTKIRDLHTKWLEGPAFRAEYDAMEEEFALASALIEARAKTGLTQEELARRMKTTQSVIARLGGGQTRPSSRTLKQIAKATGTRLKISFESDPSRPAPKVTGTHDRDPPPLRSAVWPAAEPRAAYLGGSRSELRLRGAWG